jgi:hypothetical protein
MALLLGAALILSFLQWKAWKAQKPGQGAAEAPPDPIEVTARPHLHRVYLKKAKPLDGLLRDHPSQRKADDPGPLHQSAQRVPHQNATSLPFSSRNFRQAAWQEAQGAGRSFVRGMGRNIVYLAGMAICFAIYAAIEPLVSRWQFVRDGLGWFLLVGMALAAALIFFILELCGVYLSGRPLFVRRKRTGYASGSNHWRYRSRRRDSTVRPFLLRLPRPSRWPIVPGAIAATLFAFARPHF